MKSLHARLSGLESKAQSTARASAMGSHRRFVSRMSPDERRFFSDMAHKMHSEGVGLECFTPDERRRLEVLYRRHRDSGGAP